MTVRAIESLHSMARATAVGVWMGVGILARKRAGAQEAAVTLTRDNT